MHNRSRPVVAALWSAAIPGFGQIYNRQFGKALLFIFLEFVINLYSHLNMAILYSWLFQIEKSQQVIDYQWLLFYPCFYIFAIYDAYHCAYLRLGKEEPPLIIIPFVVTWMLGTVAVIIGSGFVRFGGVEKLGPIFLGVIVILVCLIGGCVLVSRLKPR